ncbi:MAG: hypothetical protein ACJAYU_001622 [Bradymonadia bacterium]|jgi:hypothetical protein
MRRIVALLALVGCSSNPAEPTTEPDLAEDLSTADAPTASEDAPADSAADSPGDSADDLGEPETTDVGETEGVDLGASEVVDLGEPEVADVDDTPLRPSFQGCDRYAEPRRTGVLPVEIPELSGLAVSVSDPEIIWGHNDSGDGATVYGFDAAGTLLATVELSGVIALDWEDMAAGACGDEECLYVADIGDNLRLRPWVSVHRFVLPDIESGAAPVELTVEVETARLEYPDGNHDAEALVVDADGRLVVLTKDGRILTVFAAEFSTEDNVTMTLLGSLDIRDTETSMAALVTGADILLRDRLLVRTYETAFEYDLDGGLVSAAFEVTPTLVPVASERQGEAIAYGAGGFWHASEDLGAAISFVGCAE